MQKDIHYYGTYAIARVAGLKPEDAQVIAYSAQFVDDSNMDDSFMHEDGGLLYGVATAHHPIKQVPKQYISYRLNKIVNKIISHKNIANLTQRRIWIPFHFYPGNEGSSLSEKLICRKNSLIVNEMFDNHIKHTKEFPYILQLIGIASHIYMDTFSHYGFSGVSSRNNRVKSDSFQFNNTDKSMYNKKLNKFNKKHKKNNFLKNWRDDKSWKEKILIKLKSDIAEFGSGALGHGAVATFPDRPYLNWSFTYENRNETSKRNNPQTYLEGCENLYLKLKRFASLYYVNQTKNCDFSEVKNSIIDILSTKEEEEKRSKKWIEFIKNDKFFKAEEKEFLNYDPEEWEKEKKEKFHTLKTSSEIVKYPIYKFHQAADYHRHYTLKTLLPKHGIIVN